jgi:hypothetical protein
MQAVVERALADPRLEGNPEDLRPVIADAFDYELIEEVIDGSCQILKTVIHLANTDRLRFSPVRIFLRMTTSSIFLLKALSLGVRHTKLQESLEILDRSILALRSNILDDVHLASRYAILLEVHVARLRRNLVASSKAPGISQTQSHNVTRPSSIQPWGRGESQAGDTPEAVVAGFSTNVDSNVVNTDDEWLFSLPFDPSMAPFGPSGSQLSGFDGGTLDFLWNLPE